MKKSGRLRSVGLGKNWKMALDKLCREVVFARDDGCQWCGRLDRQMQWAHVRSRRYLSTRWDTRNSLKLCGGCHLLWHHQPLEAIDWFNFKFPARAKALRLHNSGTHKVDKTLIKLALEQELNKYR